MKKSVRPVFTRCTAASTSWTQAGNPKWVSARGFPFTREPLTVQNMDSAQKRVVSLGLQLILTLRFQQRDFRTVTVNEVSSGPARHQEGGVDAGFNLRHEVGDRTFFDVVLLVVFDPEVTVRGTGTVNRPQKT